MSINNAHYGTNGVLLYNGERILIYYGGVEFSIDPDTSFAIMKGTKKGKIYLTSHRVIFINKNLNDTFRSFAMPFLHMRNLDIEQPVFGANYIKGEVKAEPNGNWNGTAKFKMWFNNGGAIEFGKALMEAGRMASQNRNMNYDYSYNYGQNETIYAAPPPAYTAPPEYGWVPLDVFPDRPPENSVYTHDAPPPYSGIYPTPPRNGNVADAYYNPSEPFKAYAASAPPQDDLPPSYDESRKKKE